MDEFIRQRNIEHFEQLLATTTDEAERKILLDLLAQEEAKRPEPQKENDHRRTQSSL